MNWINTRSHSPDEAVKQSIVTAYHLPPSHVPGNHWMNLDNGEVLWMLHDGRDTFRLFRHFPVTNTVVEVTASVSGSRIARSKVGFSVRSAASWWEAFIDKLLNARDVDEVKE